MVSMNGDIEKSNRITFKKIYIFLCIKYFLINQKKESVKKLAIIIFDIFGFNCFVRLILAFLM